MVEQMEEGVKPLTTDDYTVSETDLSEKEKSLKPYGGNTVAAKSKQFIATMLGDDEGVQNAFYQSRNIAKNLNLKDNDRTEDTLRHILLGGYIDSTIGTKLINLRERFEGEEGEIDANNNEYGRLLKEMFPEEEDFMREATNAALLIGQGKEAPTINGVSLLLSFGDSSGKDFILEPNPFATNMKTNYGGEAGSAMAEGGAAMNRQMSMAFMQEGGMKDDGMDKDPVSGNDIPAGSLAKEVRDDIPAQLSEGEYVVPADVVQYYGVKFFEDLRMEAKMGLASMERNGRIGGEPISVTMIASEGEKKLSKEEEEKLKEILEANKGAYVKNYSNGGAEIPPSSFNPANFSLGFSRFNTTPEQPPAVTTQETYYHPDGRVQIVQFTNNKPAQGFEQYTKAPWSTTPPKKINTERKERSDSEPTTAPGWGQEIDFTGWNEEKFQTTIDELINPTKFAGVFGSISKISGIANAKVAAALADAKGIEVNTEGIKKAEDDLGFIAGGFNKLLNLQDLPSYVSNLIKNNTSTNSIVSSSNEEISSSSSSNEIEEPLVRKDSTSSIIKDAENEFGKDTPVVKYIKEEATKAEEQLRDIETGKNTTGRVGFKEGGLLTKPKRKPKKPKGKGLASK